MMWDISCTWLMEMDLLDTCILPYNLKNTIVHTFACRSSSDGGSKENIQQQVIIVFEPQWHTCIFYRLLLSVWVPCATPIELVAAEHLIYFLCHHYKVTTCIYVRTLHGKSISICNVWKNALMKKEMLFMRNFSVQEVSRHL